MGAWRRTAGIWGPVAFASASVAAAALEPGYSARSSPISGLAAKGTRSALVMLPGFVALGSASLVMAVPDRLAAAVVRSAGGSTLVAAAFRCSTPACPTPFRDVEARASDVGHSLASVLAFASWTALPVVSAARPGRRWYRAVNAGLAPLGITSWAWTAAASHRRSQSRGTAQRTFLATVFAWYVATAVATRGSGFPGSRCSATPSEKTAAATAGEVR